MKKTKYKAYMDGTDWGVGLPIKSPELSIFTTIKDLKANRSCVKECGIVEVEITLKKVIKKGKHF